MAWEDRAYHREGPSYGSGGGPKFIFPMPSKLTFALLISCLVVFLIQAVTGPAAAASPLVVWGSLTFRRGLAFTEPWRWITYQYLHADGEHIFWNMIGIYFFVPMLEQRWGWKRTLVFYTAGGIAAGIGYGLISVFYPGTIIGASGSIMAVLGALAVLAPDAQVLAMMIIPITMRTLALLYTIIFILMIIGSRSMSDAAHLGGMVFGVLAVRFGAPLWSGTFRKLDRQRVRRMVDQDREEQVIVDQILQKVSEQGMNSLSRKERKTLKLATEHQRQRDLEISRRRG